VAQVAAEFGASWATMMAAVVEYGTPLVDDPTRLAGVRALGVDEAAFLVANGRHHTRFVTGMVDVTAARLLDLVPGRSGTVLSQWIAAQPEPWRQSVTVAALDPTRLRHRPADLAATRHPSAGRFSMSPGSVSPPSTTPAAACTRTRPATVAARTTRCTGSGGSCDAGTSICPILPGTGS
jgi:hypothetical protein